MLSARRCRNASVLRSVSEGWHDVYPCDGNRNLCPSERVNGHAGARSGPLDAPHWSKTGGDRNLLLGRPPVLDATRVSNVWFVFHRPSSTPARLHRPRNGPRPACPMSRLTGDEAVPLRRWLGLPFSPQVSFDDDPLTLVRLQALLLDRAMQRVPLLRSHSVVSCQVCLVASDEHVTQCTPCENVVSICAICVDINEDHDETLNRASLRVSNDLTLAIEGNLEEVRDVAKLPR